ncbi:hypothetical protein ACIVBQ_002294 [Tenacibaculum discolor]
MKTDILEKYSTRIYLIILIFSILFYFVLLGTSGHQFNIDSNDKIGLILILCGIIIVPNYKNMWTYRIKKTIQMLSLIISGGTLILGIVILINLFGFKFGNDISPIVIGLFYLILLVFIVSNGILINGIVSELRK